MKTERLRWTLMGVLGAVVGGVMAWQAPSRQSASADRSAGSVAPRIARAVR